jgi:3-ketosteroid 9alpha-monooxygenase subunit A
MARYPFPANPNGWFQVATSRELASGQVKPMRFFGRELVLYRTEAGRAAMLDAYCAHQGAHLGIGGRVIGETLRCPFHAWCYDAAGACVSIPFATKIPANASVGAWPVEEKNGIVWAYHHGDGHAPDWQLPEYGLDDAWTTLRSQSWNIRVHCQEIGENAVDTAHLLHVHSQEPPSNRAIEVETDGPFFHVKQHMRMGDGMFGGMEMPVHITTCGPGVAVLRVNIGPVETMSFISQTPIDDERVTAWVNFAMKKLPDEHVTEQVCQTYAGYLNEQYTQDIPIWENKIYRHRPPLSSADGPITAWRKWYRQFYSSYEAP